MLPKPKNIWQAVLYRMRKKRIASLPHPDPE